MKRRRVRVNVTAELELAHARVDADFVGVHVELARDVFEIVFRRL